MGMGKGRRVALRVVLVTVAAFLIFEGAVRLLLFSEVAAGWELARALRKPALLAHWDAEDLYWQLQLTFERGGELRDVPGYDPRLGWVGGSVTPGDYRHLEADLVDGRRPVLLYGDSFSECLTDPEQCFQGLMEASQLGATHKLLNHGVAGYGLDQTALMLEGSIGHFADLDPVVIVGILVDDDLDRCSLSLRGWPKPRFRLVGDALELEREPVSREAQPPPFLAGYGLRLLMHGTGASAAAFDSPGPLHGLFCPGPGLQRANQERARAVVARIAETLRSNGHEAFFLLFHSQGSVVDPSKAGWREPLLVEQLERLGVAWISTRPALASHAAASGRSMAEYYGHHGHLTALGNQVAFRTLRDGLEGRFDLAPEWGERDLLAPLSAQSIASTTLGGPRAAARYSRNRQAPFTDRRDYSRLVFQVGRQGPTEVSYDLAGRAAGFSAEAWILPPGTQGKPRDESRDEPGGGSVGLTLLGDGEVLLQTRLETPLEGPPARQPVAVDLAGRQTLTIRVDDAGDGVRGDRLVLSSPLFD